MGIKIQQRKIGLSQKPFIIAEMSGNHNQDLDRALEIVEAAAETGAHALKLQTNTADTITLDVKEGDFFKENNLKFDDISQVFVNQGPGNFSGLRGSLAIAKGVSLAKNLNLFGYNTFIWSCAKFFNKKDSIFSLIKFREKYFIKKFDKNLNSASKVEEVTVDEIIKKYDNKFNVIPRNMVKYFDKKILKLNNLNIVDLDHNELEFLQLKGLLDKELIKPLYLS